MYPFCFRRTDASRSLQTTGAVRPDAVYPAKTIKPEYRRAGRGIGLHGGICRRLRIFISFARYARNVSVTGFMSVSPTALS
jgi:hypothetical protein